MDEKFGFRATSRALPPERPEVSGEETGSHTCHQVHGAAPPSTHDRLCQDLLLSGLSSGLGFETGGGRLLGVLRSVQGRVPSGVAGKTGPGPWAESPIRESHPSAGMGGVRVLTKADRTPDFFSVKNLNHISL